VISYTRSSRLIIGLVIYALCACSAQAEILSGKVVKIADGDTLTILDKSNRQHKVRLIGIDAPERKQPFGNVSRQNLADLVFGKTIAVEWHKQDRYQRVLGKVLLNGKDVNLEQIKAGLAWHYKQYDRDQLPADRKLMPRLKRQPVSRALDYGMIPQSALPVMTCNPIFPNCRSVAGGRVSTCSRECALTPAITV
jgi:endonuclease YncB( thermonuclease family)